jgi:hypothetical protein
MLKNRAISRWAAAAFLACVVSACTVADEKSWLERPSSYGAYGGRPGVPSGGGP